MRAIEQRGYGDPGEVLHLAEVDVPEIAADGVLSAGAYGARSIPTTGISSAASRCSCARRRRPPGSEAGRGW